MNTYVHLNDIFDIQTPTVMEMRINHSFGTDGTDFWQEFFPCDKVHKNDRIIYLFTEYQLEFLWKWWNDKLKTSDKNTRLNLEYSMQKLFNTAMTAQKEKLVDQIYVGYLNCHESQPKIQRVFFGLPPYKRMKIRYNDFFSGRFRGKPVDNTLTEEGSGEQLLKLVKMRTEIEKVFHISLKKNEKWLRYLGPKYANVRCIEHCICLSNICPYKLG